MSVSMSVSVWLDHSEFTRMTVTTGKWEIVWSQFIISIISLFKN